ncbi:PREDICTED: histone-lysine N-methyltransferase SETMAR [Papilio xuthus]|uniref:Histone-lysine N-methyltransferase SETMAR n=1 Tax=Papilio xuthus TaxID=66420 RepID=A0AAJ6Z727_PAPXU|nr:PREDICTED: histone-lysine N-methyltransferase SETMAR [Papilio xuthus]
MNDHYDHTSPDLIYVVENIPGPAEDNEEYEELFNNYNSQLSYKCECIGSCINESCFCIHNSRGKNYNFSDINNLKSYKIIDNKKSDKSIFECNDLCSCIRYCGNKLVQEGPLEGLFVKPCYVKEKGMGLFTKHLIDKGSYICEYAGEIITKSQALKRHQINVNNMKMNFIFCLNEYSNNKVTQTFVDPSSFGNIGRYINHSCEPNCFIVPIRVNTPLPKLAIFSLTEISAEHEITIDYGSKTCNDLNIEVNVHGRKPCLCYSNNCKGILPYDLY